MTAELIGLVWIAISLPQPTAITLYTDSTVVNHALPTGEGPTIRRRGA
jgi:hypothetical protein